MKKISFVVKCLSFCCLCLWQTVNASEKFSQGYVITLTNDTLKGYIQQYKVNLFAKCRFKKEINETVKEYSPGQIHSFRFIKDGKFFVSKNAPTDDGSKILFLEFLVKGGASMYYYKDDMDHFYLETAKNGMVELSQRPQIVTRADGVTQYRQNIYTGKLKSIMADCPDLFPEIDKSYLSHSDMIKITKEYNDRVCTSEHCVVFEQKIKHIKFDFSIVGGVALNHFKYCSVSTDSKISPQIGCRLSVANLFFSNELMTFQTGLFVQKFGSYTLNFDPEVYNIWYKNGNLYDYIFINQNNHKVSSKLNVLVFKVPIMVNYVFSNAKLAPYIGAGIMNTFTKSNNIDFYTTNYSVSDHFPSYLVGVEALLGLRYKLTPKHNIFSEVTYEYSKDLNNVDGYNSLKNYSCAFVIGYTF